MASAALELLIQLKDEASSGLAAITGGLGNVGKAALTVAGGGLLAIGGGLTAAIGAGLNFNNSMEQVSAQLMAFTKDGAATAAILDMIKTRAASTPFAFEDMATAATALLPASKAAGVGLEELIAQAEILAASNPAEGLEGAAFALKEAAGGDFASAIERFNLPRQYINQLKEEGVPNLEILSRAMGQLGLDADLVSGLANTASGRWSTFLDTMTNVAAEVSKPIFSAFSSGLAGVQTVLDANMPAITAFAGVLAGQLASAIQWLIGTGVPMLIAGWQGLQPALASVGDVLTMVAGLFMQLWTSVQPLLPSLQGALVPALIGLAAVIGGGIVVALGSMVAAMVAAAAPIVALVAAAGALYAAWSSNFLGIQTIVTGVLGAVLGIVQSVGAQIVGFWQANGASIMTSAQAAWSGLQALVSAALSGVWSVVSAIGGQIAAFWQANGQAILATVQSSWAQVGPIISGALQIAGAVIQAFAAVVTAVFGAIVTFLQAHSGSIQAILTGAWQIIQGAVTTAMGVISGIIRTVLAVIKGDWSGAWQGLQDIVRAILNGIGPILSGIGTTIKGMIGLAASAIADVAAAVGNTALSIGKAIVSGIISGVSSAAGALTSKLKEMAKGALDAAKSALGIASPSKAFADQVGLPITQGIIAGFVAGMPKVNGNLLKGVGLLMEKVAGIVDAGATAMSKLGGFSGARGTGIDGFLSSIQEIAIKFAATADVLGGRVLGTANRFSETAGKVVGMVGSAVESINTLQDFVQPTRAAVGAFGDALALVVGVVSTVASWFQQKSIDAGAKFSEGASKMLGVVGPAIEAFKKLPDLVVPSRVAVGYFGDTLALVVGNIAYIATLFAAQGVAAGAVFADGAGKMLAIIGAGVDGFTKLATFQGIPGAAMYLFSVALHNAVFQLVGLSRMWTADAVAAAAVFADGAGKAIAIIGGGVEGFVKLAAFQGVPQTAIDAFGVALNAAFAVIEYIAASWIPEFVVRAAVFADGAGKAIGIIGGAVEGFVTLAAFEGVPEVAMSAFGSALNAALTVIESMSATWATTGLTQAVAWAQSVDAIVKTITTAIDAITKLGQLQTGASGLLDTFSATLGGLLTEMQTHVLPAMETVGGNMMIGLANGITAQRSALVNAMIATVWAAVQAAQGALGIASPSKVFEQIGQYAGEGMVGGLGAMQPAVAGAGAGLGVAAVGGAVSGGGGGGGALSITFAPGSIVVNGVAGAFTEKHLQLLADKITEKIANDRGGR